MIIIKSHHIICVLCIEYLDVFRLFLLYLPKMDPQFITKKSFDMGNCTCKTYILVLIQKTIIIWETFNLYSVLVIIINILNQLVLEYGYSIVIINS